MRIKGSNLIQNVTSHYIRTIHIPKRKGWEATYFGKEIIVLATSRNIPQIINAHNGDSKTKAKHHDHKKAGTFNPPIVSKGKKLAACWLCFSLLISACFKSIRYIRTFEKVLQLS